MMNRVKDISIDDGYIKRITDKKKIFELKMVK